MVFQIRMSDYFWGMIPGASLVIAYLGLLLSMLKSMCVKHSSWRIIGLCKANKQTDYGQGSFEHIMSLPAIRGINVSSRLLRTLACGLPNTTS